MNKYFPFILALCLLFLLSVIEGFISGRFGNTSSDLLNHLVTVVNDTPMALGNWVGENNDPTKDVVLKETGALGYVSRTYLNHSIDQTVSLYFIAGRSEKVAIHPPTACYPASGYTQLGNPATYEFHYSYKNPKTGQVQGRLAHFFTVVFSKDTERIRVFWAWNNGTEWEAPSFPRNYYGGHTPLCKCYFIMPETSKKNKIDEIPINNFATAFLTAIDEKMLVDGQLPYSKATIEFSNETAAADNSGVPSSMPDKQAENNRGSRIEDNPNSQEDNSEPTQSTKEIMEDSIDVLNQDDVRNSLENLQR